MIAGGAVPNQSAPCGQARRQHAEKAANEGRDQNRPEPKRIELGQNVTLRKSAESGSAAPKGRCRSGPVIEQKRAFACAAWRAFQTLVEGAVVRFHWDALGFRRDLADEAAQSCDQIAPDLAAIMPDVLLDDETHGFDMRLDALNRHRH